MKRALIIVARDDNEAEVLHRAGRILGLDVQINSDFNTGQLLVRWIDHDGEFVLYHVPEGSPIARYNPSLRRDARAIQSPGKQGDALQEREVVGEAGLLESRECNQSSGPAPYEGIRIEKEMRNQEKQFLNKMPILQTHRDKDFHDSTRSAE